MSIAIREQKEKQVAEILEMLSKSSAFVLIDYKGISVKQDTEMRIEFRNNGVRYHVLKNRLVNIALTQMGHPEFEKALNGPTAIAMATTDIAAPARIASEKVKSFKKMTIKCGLVDGVYLDEANCQVLASLPSKNGLISQLLGMLQAPIASFARTISAIAEQKA